MQNFSASHPVNQEFAILLKTCVTSTAFKIRFKLRIYTDIYFQERKGTYCSKAACSLPFTKNSAADWTREFFSVRLETYLKAPMILKLSAASAMAQFASRTVVASCI